MATIVVFNQFLKYHFVSVLQQVVSKILRQFIRKDPSNRKKFGKILGCKLVDKVNVTEILLLLLKRIPTTYMSLRRKFIRINIVLKTRVQKLTHFELLIENRKGIFLKLQVLLKTVKMRRNDSTKSQQLFNYKFICNQLMSIVLVQ